MHAVAYFVTPEPAKRGELQQVLESLARGIREEAGCEVCSVCLVSDGELFIVVSGWQSRADLERHLCSEHFQVLSGASRLLGAKAEVRVLTSEPGSTGSRN
jgi:quinol monooxygenase YgiN